MSVLLTAATEAALHHLSAASPIAAAGDAGSQGILDLISQKNQEVQTVARSLGVTAAVIFVIVNAIKSSMAIARIVVAGLAAGVFVWVVWNITDLQSRVNDEVNSMPAVTSVVQHDPSHRLQLWQRLDARPAPGHLEEI